MVFKVSLLFLVHYQTKTDFTPSNMCDKAEEIPSPGNNYEETKVKNDKDGAAGGKSRKMRTKFSVNRVQFDSELTNPLEKSADDSYDHRKSPPSEANPEQYTFEYATNEAIPMTIFYRSQHSVGHDGKQRPTLQELRKCLDENKVRTF